MGSVDSEVFGNLRFIEFRNQLSTQLCQLTTGNKEIEVLGQFDIRTLVGSIAKFRQLTDNVFALRFLSHLVLNRHIHKNMA